MKENLFVKIVIITIQIKHYLVNWFDCSIRVVAFSLKGQSSLRKIITTEY